jgi:hypothetical protein
VQEAVGRSAGREPERRRAARGQAHEGAGLVVRERAGARERDLRERAAVQRRGRPRLREQPLDERRGERLVGAAGLARRGAVEGAQHRVDEAELDRAVEAMTAEARQRPARAALQDRRSQRAHDVRGQPRLVAAEQDDRPVGGREGVPQRAALAVRRLEGRVGAVPPGSAPGADDGAAERGPRRGHDVRDGPDLVTRAGSEDDDERRTHSTILRMKDHPVKGSSGAISVRPRSASWSRNVSSASSRSRPVSASTRCRR